MDRTDLLGVVIQDPGSCHLIVPPSSTTQKKLDTYHIQKESRGGLFNVLISRPRHIASAHILLTRTWPSNCRGAGKCSPAKRPGLNHNSIFMTEGENRFGQIISLATLTKLPDIIIVIQVTKLN